jgi:hypothetical protein
VATAVRIGGIKSAAFKMPDPPAVHSLGTLASGVSSSGGRGKISGTVKAKSLPDNTPLARKTFLFREPDGLLVATTWSSATDGSYVFSGIDATKKYTVVAYDHLHNYRAVIADNLTPDPM